MVGGFQLTLPLSINLCILVQLVPAQAKHTWGKGCAGQTVKFAVRGFGRGLCPSSAQAGPTGDLLCHSIPVPRFAAPQRRQLPISSIQESILSMHECFPVGVQSLKWPASSRVQQLCAGFRRVEYGYFDEAACKADNAWIEPPRLASEVGSCGMRCSPTEAAYASRDSTDRNVGPSTHRGRVCVCVCVGKHRCRISVACALAAGVL